MDDLDQLHNQIYDNMQLKTDDELMLILEQDDHEEWSDSAFEVARQILIQRTGKLPEFPSISSQSTDKPIEWEDVDWRAIADRCDKVTGRAGSPFPVLIPLFLISMLFGVNILLSSSNRAAKLTEFTLLFFLVSVLLGAIIWYFRRTQKAELIIAKARVYLKCSTSRSRGAFYDVGFALKSAFTITDDGKLVTNNRWNHHHIFSIPNHIYERLEEQEIVDLIFLSNNKILGLLEDLQKS